MVVGLMAIKDFVMAPYMVRDLSFWTDHIVIRFDACGGDRGLLRSCLSQLHSTDVTVIEGTAKWNRWNWREELIRSVDAMAPELVLFPDSDEAYGAGFEDDLDAFRKSKANLMIFGYTMITIDNRHVKRYPGGPHCKAYKWYPGITYKPYRGWAMPNMPAFVGNGEHISKSKMQHYCFYTPQMEKEKELHL